MPSNTASSRRKHTEDAPLSKPVLKNALTNLGSSCSSTTNLHTMMPTDEYPRSYTRGGSFHHDDTFCKYLHKDDTNVSDAEEETVERTGFQKTGIKDFPTNQCNMGKRDAMHAESKKSTATVQPKSIREDHSLDDLYMTTES